MVGRDLSDCGQDMIYAEGQAERGERRLATRKVLGHQTHECDEDGAHSVEPPPRPTDSGRQQDVVPADDTGGELDAASVLDFIDDLLDVVQRAGESCGEAIGQQAEGLLSCWAIPARNACARRVESRVGADVVKSATTPRMSGTSKESCRLPRPLANVLLAGEA